MSSFVFNKSEKEKFTSCFSVLLLLADAKAKIGAAISVANWHSVFFATDLSTVIPFVTKSSCCAVEMIALTFVLKAVSVVAKAGTVATIAADRKSVV